MKPTLRSALLTLLFFSLAGCANGHNSATPAQPAASPGLAPTEAAEPRSTGRGYAKVRLGIRPSMAEGGEPGVLVQSVSPGTSAANGGLKPGDLIVAWDGEDLIDVMDMLERLRSLEPGDEVELVVVRDGEDLKLTIDMQASNQERQD